jgi:predicted transcriptional regulator
MVDRKIVRLLSKLGLEKNIAKVIVFLAEVKEATSREIDLAADLRQPEVSSVMRELRELGWIAERELSKEGKGRPMKSYKLTVELKDIVSEITKRKRDELSKVKENLARLEELAGLM